MYNPQEFLLPFFDVAQFLLFLLSDCQNGSGRVGRRVVVRRMPLQITFPNTKFIKLYLLYLLEIPILSVITDKIRIFDCIRVYTLIKGEQHRVSGRQILASNEKYYIADHGIREAVFGGNMRDINLVLENIVFLEMLRRGYTVTVGKTCSKETDFVCEKRGEKLYVQVSYLLASAETIHREFGAYADIRDNFPKYVISLDEFDMSRDGIKHRNVRDFLLADSWE